MMDAQKERAEQFRKQQIWKAEMVIKAYNPDDFSYSDCVLMLKNSLEILESLPVFDPATEYFVRQVNHWRKLCTAIALIDGKEARDHLQEIPVIWSYDKGRVIEETTLWIPLGTRPIAIDAELKVAGSLRLAKAGIEYKVTATLEVVRA